MGMRGPKSKRKQVVWSADLAYGIGLMASDGCLSPDGRHLLFVSKDIEQIEHIRSIFNLKVRVGRVRSGRHNSLKEYFRVQWGDAVLYNFLLSIVQNFKYFLGSCIFYISLESASEKHILWVQKTIHSLLEIKGHISKRKKRKTGTVMYSLRFAKKDTLSLLRKLYLDQSVICLSRKRLKIEGALGIVGLSLPK